MQTEAIINTLLSAARFLKKPLQDVAAEPLKDAYEAAKSYLWRKFGEDSEAGKALDLATEKPESLIRKALLAEESASADLENDRELAGLIESLSAFLPESSSVAQQSVHVGGWNNQVQVAGRDIVTTAKHVQRNAITPDERHISVEQRKRIGAVIGRLAEQLADEEGNPAFGVAHRMIQRRFNVASYLLVPREKYDDALGFLKQQCAIKRASLGRRNPDAYRNDFFRSIHARREKLGWDKAELYQFATEKLGLKKPIASLNSLGSIQLKSLGEFMQRQAASMAGC